MLDGRRIRLHRRMAEIRLRDVAGAIGRSVFFMNRVERNLAVLDESEERVIRKYLSIPPDDTEHEQRI